MFHASNAPSQPRKIAVVVAALAVIALSLAALPVLAAKPKAPAVPEEPDPVQTPDPAQKPKAFVQALNANLDVLVAKHSKLDALQDAIGDQLVGNVDFAYMAERILPEKTLAGLKAEQRAEFLELLQKMLRRTYVKRFKPGHKVAVKYGKIRQSKGGRVQVRTEVTVKRTRAEVWYSMRPVAGQWRIYDIVVDEASQLRTYRKSFRKVLKKDGWDALIERMTKSATRK